MNRRVGEESAPLVKDILVELFRGGFQGPFKEVRLAVEAKLGHRVHSSFVARPLQELMREEVAMHYDLCWQTRRP